MHNKNKIQSVTVPHLVSGSGELAVSVSVSVAVSISDKHGYKRPGLLQSTTLIRFTSCKTAATFGLSPLPTNKQTTAIVYVFVSIKNSLKRFIAAAAPPCGTTNGFVVVAAIIAVFSSSPSESSSTISI